MMKMVKMMKYKVFITTDYGRMFYIDQQGSITGLFSKKFESFDEAKEYALQNVVTTFKNYSVFIEEYVSPTKTNSVKIA